jgi:carboxyl-terminal processing protease
MKAVFRTLAVFVSLAFVVTLSYFALASTAAGSQTTTQTTSASNGAVADKVAEAEAYLDHYFVEDTDDTALGDAAVSAMIEATGDRWSYYISAEDYQAYLENMNNAYVGIGVTIQWNEDEAGYEIMSVTAGGPAETAGVQAGDILLFVDGESVEDLGLDGTKSAVRGEEGTSVTLTFRRAGETFDLSVTRASIETVVVSYEMLDDQIGLITIENFDTNCAKRAMQAIETLIGEGAQSLIFDVRYNPGGMKTELVELLDYLLPEGPLFYSYYYDGTSDVDYSDASYLDIPMAVLVNADSYSAAEFFAAALQEYGAAEVVGVQTCGKGYFQNTFRLSDGSAMAISTGRYCTPNGVSLAGVGITPDVVVELTEEQDYLLYYGQLDHAEDDQLQAAIALLTGD